MDIYGIQHAASMSNTSLNAHEFVLAHTLPDSLQGREHGSFLVKLKNYIHSRQQFLQDLHENAAQQFDLPVNTWPHGLGGLLPLHMSADCTSALTCSIKINGIRIECILAACFALLPPLCSTPRWPPCFGGQMLTLQVQTCPLLALLLLLQEVSLEEASEALNRQYIRGNKVIDLAPYLSRVEEEQ